MILPQKMCTITVKLLAVKYCSGSQSTYPCDHCQSAQVQRHADPGRHLFPVGQQSRRPVVNDPGDQGLNAAELGVNAQDLDINTTLVDFDK